MTIIYVELPDHLVDPTKVQFEFAQLVEDGHHEPDDGVQLLADGWRPFAVQGHTMYFTRKVWRPNVHFSPPRTYV